jgi:hypothetical protein
LTEVIIKAGSKVKEFVIKKHVRAHAEGTDIHVHVVTKKPCKVA